MIKYSAYFLLLILFGIFNSCNSPNPVENEPPIITIYSNDSTLALGDSLKLSLEVTDLSLAQGTVDFKDGNVVAFNNLKQVLDTTIIHCYKAVGSYDVEVSFTDGEMTTTRRLRVEVANYSPLIIMSTNTTILEVDDSLNVTLHVSGSNLTNGYLDFKDGTIITFSDLNLVLDTTVVHKFTLVGLYNITASFTDGDTTATTSIAIQVKDDPPIVHLTVNKTDLRLGDTLKVFLHVSDAISGTLDFNDGTRIYFSNFNHDLDTMIVHIYTQPGYPYCVNATFSDGNNSNYWQISVTVSRYYELVLSVGMKWRFKHKDGFSTVIGDHIHNSTQGIHEWEIISFTNQDSIFTVKRTICDTIHASSDQGDTNYIAISSSQFTIVGLYKTITFNVPLAGSPFTVPNHSPIDSYPVKASGNTYGGDLICIDIIGPVSYHYSSSTMYSNTFEELTMIDFIKP